METTAPGVYRTFDDLYPIVTTRVRQLWHGWSCRVPCWESNALQPQTVKVW